MSSPKGRILQFFGGLVLRDARIVSVQADARFVTIGLAGPALAEVQPGDKVQVLLPSGDVRTYTPIPGTPVELRVYLHGDTPGPRWARAAKFGDFVRFVGPSRSLVLPEGRRVIIGDETSVAVGLAYAGAGGAEVLIESDGPIEGVRTFARGDHAGLAAAVPEGAVVGLTGGAPLIQGVRAALRARGIGARVKAYWAPGKSGLD